MGAIFRFKQFAVDQGNCAMKINTDGVLLGAFAQQQAAVRILDIGTGTGVIALMLAQSHPQATVDAVEIDPEAAEQAAENFRQAPFADRLRLFACSFLAMQPGSSYDLIVSNPPFYTNSLHNPDPRKKLAKHTDHLFFESLIDFVDMHLAASGRFLCIVPTALADELLLDFLPVRQLYVQRELAISSFPGGSPIRKLLSIGRESVHTEHAALAIYEQKGVYTAAYKALLSPYFLAF